MKKTHITPVVSGLLITLMLALQGCKAGAAASPVDPQDFKLSGTVEAVNGDSITLDGQTITMPGLGEFLTNVKVGETITVKVDMENGEISDVEVLSGTETPETDETPEATETMEPMETAEATETMEPMETAEATEAPEQDSDNGDHKDENDDHKDDGDEGEHKDESDD